ncbi:R3H domain-containing protein 4 isoform X1 [Populus alba x Populus x berolinensis]|nr:R3H domain-containing protein 4 isoform X1 [Populus alba x Populus x berolinensis]
MATLEVLQMVEEGLLSSPPKAENEKARDLSIEKKIDFLESLTGKVSNRRSRRWLNDRLLMELVPRLDAEEIRGLFAPPPWGDDVPLSPFCMTNMGEWDKFRNIDMDKQANIIDRLNRRSVKREGRVDADKMAVLNAWHRIDCRTRDALRRSFLVELIESYEACIRVFIEDGGDEVLSLQVQDPFHRLLLHGVCEFYNLASVTETESKDAVSFKTTKIKKKMVVVELPNITLSNFLKMSKEGVW